MRDHNSYFKIISSEFPEPLIFVDKCELSTRGVHQDLMDHVVGDSAEFDHIEPDYHKCSEHERQHSRVSCVEGILFNQVVENEHGNQVF